MRHRCGMAGGGPYRAGGGGAGGRAARQSWARRHSGTPRALPLPLTAHDDTSAHCYRAHEQLDLNRANNNNVVPFH